MKRLLLLSVAVGFSTIVSAQLSYKVKAGLNAAKIKFTSPGFSSSIKPGFYLGGVANYEVQEKLNLQAELLFSLEGTKEKNKIFDDSGSITEGYLHLPVLGQYEFYEGLYAETGIQLGLLLSSKEVYGGKKANIKPYYNSVDLRWPIGVGYRFQNERLNGLSLNLRYSMSLGKINKVSVGGGSLKNQVISIGAQYPLPLK